MEYKTTDSDPSGETALIELIASLHREVTPEAHFEERFLYDFHEQVARAAVCCPARRRLWDHVLQVFSNLGGRKLVYGASTLGAGVLAVGFFAFPPVGNQSLSQASAGNCWESCLSSLGTSLSREVEPYTMISVNPTRREDRMEDSLVSLRGADCGIRADLGYAEYLGSSFTQVNLSDQEGLFPMLEVPASF